MRRGQTDPEDVDFFICWSCLTEQITALSPRRGSMIVAGDVTG
jgi:hypothetical protein